MESERTGRAALPRRRLLLAIVVLAASVGVGVARAQQGTSVDAPSRGERSRPRAHALPAARDLAADGATARARRIPILILFDRDDCPYCERALREHLVPMSREAPWRDDALFRQVEVDRDDPVVGFDGRPTTHRAIASRFDAKFTPTIVVVGSDGKALADPVVGLLTADFYGAYLDAALKQGLATLRR
ncbi:MAG: hypothetical protein DYH14_05735 [Betaproteobacteria bacterium PRO3]|nr:hypothetical protein [Betaproteobacteria bacterium PRO3]